MRQILLLLFVIYIGNAISQEADRELEYDSVFVKKRNVIKTNPIGVVFNGYSIGYEYVLSKHFSLYLNGVFQKYLYSDKLYASNHSYDYDLNYMSLMGVLECRYYMVRYYRRIPKGPYAGFTLYFQNTDEEAVFNYTTDYQTEYDYTKKILTNAFGPGVMVGYQFVFNSRYVLDLKSYIFYSFYEIDNKTITRVNKGKYDYNDFTYPYPDIAYFTLEIGYLF
jgi:hypothetical protein